MRLSEVKKHTTTALGVMVATIVFFVTWSGLEAYLNQIVDKRINDPEYIKKVADQVRPYIIFDGSGVIFADGGALQYLDSITVIEKGFFGKDQYGKEYFYPKKMIIKPKAFMTNEPLIQCLVNELFDMDIQRSAPIGWTVYMSYTMGPIGNASKLKFRLEIIR